MLHDEDDMNARTQFRQAMDSSFMKLVQNVLLGLLCYLGVQTMNRLDRLEQLNVSTQVGLANAASATLELKQEKEARAAELSALHGQVGDLVTRLSVLEARMTRK